MNPGIAKSLNERWKCGSVGERDGRRMRGREREGDRSRDRETKREGERGWERQREEERQRERQHWVGLSATLIGTEKE